MNPHDALLFFVVIPLATIAGLAGIAVRVWYVMRIRQWEMSLKHTMLERGMSAEEIKTVLEASARGPVKKFACWSNAGNA
jgi:hypothetical protein